MMDINSIYQVYFNYALQNKDEVYSFISKLVSPHDFTQRKIVVDLLNERDKVGSTLIAEHILLPHIESSLIKKSQFIFLRLAHPIESWGDREKDIRLLIIILLKRNETQQVKRKISLFTQALANEEYLHELLKVEEEVAFDEIIKKIQEE